MQTVLPGARTSVDKPRVEAKATKLVPIVKGGRGHSSQPLPHAMYSHVNAVGHSSLVNGVDTSKTSVSGPHANNMLKLPAISARKATPAAKPVSHGVLNGKPGGGAISTPGRVATVEVMTAADSAALGGSNPSSKHQIVGKAPETPGSAKRGASNRNDFFKSLKKKEASTMTQAASEASKPTMRSQSSSDSVVSAPTSPVAGDATGGSAGTAVVEAAKPPSVVTTAVEYESYSSAQLTQKSSGPVSGGQGSTLWSEGAVQRPRSGEPTGSAIARTALSNVTPAVQVESPLPPPPKTKPPTEVLLYGPCVLEDAVKV